jgi:hypothetical protein
LRLSSTKATHTSSTEEMSWSSTAATRKISINYSIPGPPHLTHACPEAVNRPNPLSPPTLAPLELAAVMPPHDSPSHQHHQGEILVIHEPFPLAIGFCFTRPSWSSASRSWRSSPVTKNKRHRHWSVSYAQFHLASPLR